MRIPFPFLALSMLFFSVAFNISEARMPEPASMPYSLRGGEPHNPRVAKYYLEELVSEGKMTKEEAERIAALNKANNNKVSQNAAGATATGGFLFPLAWSNGVTCAYGPRTHPIYGYQSNHTGVDLGSGMNTEIYATKSGTVTASSYGEANGYYTTINHGDGYSSLYAHMVSNEVSVGDYVTQGQVIGHVGMSGWTTGAHLHFEILYNGSNVNPMNYISLP